MAKAMRADTVQDHQERINKVLIHLKENPGATFTIHDLARIACFSPFHFHRLFAAYVGEPLSAHVRRLRLERAAAALQQSPASITEIALDAGYETPGAFTKAFQQQFGVSPTHFRRRPLAALQAVSPAINKSTTPIPMKPEIMVRPETTVLFVRRTGAYRDSAAGAWEAVCRYAFSHQLVEPDCEYIGISHDDPEITEAAKLRYDACITLKRAVKPAGEVGLQKIAGGRYAVFLHKGPYERLLETYRFIFREWLPASGEQLRDAPGFELYVNTPQHTKPANLRTKIHLPLK